MTKFRKGDIVSIEAVVEEAIGDDVCIRVTGRTMTHYTYCAPSEIKLVQAGAWQPGDTVHRKDVPNPKHFELQEMFGLAWVAKDLSHPFLGGQSPRRIIIEADELHLWDVVR